MTSTAKMMERTILLPLASDASALDMVPQVSFLQISVKLRAQTLLDSTLDLLKETLVTVLIAVVL